MSALPPKADTRIGTFSQTGTLGDLIHRPLPTPLSLFHGLQHSNPIGRVVFGNRKLYGLTRTRQRFRCLEVRNRFIGTLTALAVFVIAGKARVAIDLVCQCVKFAHTCTRFIGGLVQALPGQILGGGSPTLLRADRGSQFQFGKFFVAHHRNHTPSHVLGGQRSMGKVGLAGVLGLHSVPSVFDHGAG